MSATIKRDKHGIWEVHVSGGLRKEEMDAIQAAGIQGIGQDNHARVLVMVEPDFRGWVGAEEWNDMSFLVTHGDRISRIAIVGDPKWESRMLMFAGAGLRRTQVRYFAGNRLADAYVWLDA
jgi:hypothetical protein